MIELSEQQVIDQVAERLGRLYPAVPADVVSRVVADEHARFVGRPVRDFIPLFVERSAKSELSELADA